MIYKLENGSQIELTDEDLGGINWMCWKQTFRAMADDFLSWNSKAPQLYSEEDKDELADRITELFFNDEDLDDMKIRHAITVIEEMDEELTNENKGEEHAPQKNE